MTWAKPFQICKKYKQSNFLESRLDMNILNASKKFLCFYFYASKKLRFQFLCTQKLIFQFYSHYIKDKHRKSLNLDGKKSISMHQKIKISISMHEHMIWTHQHMITWTEHCQWKITKEKKLAQIHFQIHFAVYFSSFSMRKSTLVLVNETPTEFAEHFDIIPL
jgi:hypothetical protein